MPLLRTCNAVIRPEASNSGRKLYPQLEMRVAPPSPSLLTHPARAGSRAQHVI